MVLFGKQGLGSRAPRPDQQGIQYLHLIFFIRGNVTTVPGSPDSLSHGDQLCVHISDVLNSWPPVGTNAEKRYWVYGVPKREDIEKCSACNRGRSAHNVSFATVSQHIFPSTMWHGYCRAALSSVQGGLHRLSVKRLGSYPNLLKNSPVYL